MCTGDARKRIAAIRRCSNLGAGFRLALHDLEIRGSGNLLGAEQSGHLNLIGFDLYCQLLQIEIARLKGERLDLPPETEVLIDFVAAGYEAPAPLLAAGFPPSYIPDAAQRLTVCRRTDRIASLDEWQDFRKELIDRYGPLPKPAETLLKIAELRLLTAAAHAEKLQVEAGKVYLKSKRGIYRKNGLVPTVSEKNPPELRLALIRHIVLEAQKSEEI